MVAEPPRETESSVICFCWKRLVGLGEGGEGAAECCSALGIAIQLTSP
jgi:hypothetical protein